MWEITSVVTYSWNVFHVTKYPFAIAFHLKLADNPTVKIEHHQSVISSEARCFRGRSDIILSLPGEVLTSNPANEIASCDASLICVLGVMANITIY